MGYIRGIYGVYTEYTLSKQELKQGQKWVFGLFFGRKRRIGMKLQNLKCNTAKCQSGKLEYKIGCFLLFDVFLKTKYFPNSFEMHNYYTHFKGKILLSIVV